MGKEITFDKFIRWAGVTLIVLAVLYMTNYLSSVLLPFFIAWFFAYLLYPVVKFIENKLHVRIRALSILIAMGTAIAVIGGVLWLIIPPMIDQFDKLGEVLTRWLHQTTHTNNLTALIKDWLQANQEQIEHFLKSKDFSDAIKTTMPKVFSVVSQTATVLMSIVASMITLLYMFFILLDYETLTANWVRIFPKKNRPFWSALMKDVERELNNYIRGQGLVALCMGIMFCIGFTIIGFPMAIGLGILIGIMDLVPYLHTFALIPTAFLAMLKAADTGQNFWLVFGLAVLVFCVVQVITDMVVTPKIMGKAMGLNPAILLLSLSVWGALLGFLGLIVALPLTTLIIAYWQRYVTKEKPQYHEKTGENVPISDKNKENQRFSDETLDSIVRACYAMGSVCTGALIVVEQVIQLTEYEMTGIELDCKVSSQVLINIFEHNTPLHDGAVIIRDFRIHAAGCFLPLTTRSIGNDLGTRHRAAIGISEVSDAIVVVVSEETGIISVACEGDLRRDFTADTLRTKLKKDLLTSHEEAATAEKAEKKLRRKSK